MVNLNIKFENILNGKIIESKTLSNFRFFFSNMFKYFGWQAPMQWDV